MAVPRCDTIYGGDKLSAAATLFQKTVSASAQRIKNFVFVRRGTVEENPGSRCRLFNLTYYARSTLTRYAGIEQ
jgi:hypothetical protein